MARLTAPPGLELIKRLKTMTGQKQSQGFDRLLVVSVGMLPLAGDDDPFWAVFDQMLWDFKARYKTALYELSLPDRAILLKSSAIAKDSTASPVTDLNVRLLRLIRSCYPDSFLNLVHSRLVNELNLTTEIKDALALVEGLENRPGKTGDKKQKTGRRLEQQDIDKVAKVSRELGLPEFSKAFIRSQKVLHIKPGAAGVHVMDEYFVAIDALKSYVFKGVDMRGSGALFDQLTLTLDTVLLNGFRTLKTNDDNGNSHLSTLNLNVESVFSESFRNFVDAGKDAALTGMVFEFRQSDIVTRFDTFQVACDWIHQLGGKIAVDAIFPESVGLVNLTRLDVDYAKIFWRKGAGDVLDIFSAAIGAAQKKGIDIVFARVDEDAAIKFGHKTGVELYQGYHIDNL